MKTSFASVYSRFLGKITDDMYVELTPEDTIKDLRNLLLDAIPSFEFPRINLYDYSFVNYIDNQTKVKILDNETGDIFWQTPNSHLTGSGNPKRKRSSGEMLIQKLLKDFNIDFKEEYVLKNIIQGRNIKNIRIDFRLLNLSKEIWIEYNGIQHYKYEKNFFKETLDDYRKQLTRDKNVRDYCKEHDILLIEIPYTYTKYEILKPILEDILFSGKSPEDIIIYPEIEMYTKFFKT